MIEHKVGAIVEDNGVKYLAVKGLSCFACDMEKHGQCIAPIKVFGFCSSYSRHDKQNIGWEIVK